MNNANDNTRSINSIIDNIKRDNIDEAIRLFIPHISNIKQIGTFSKNTWERKWCEQVYSFGQLFKDRNPIKFLNFLSEEKQKSRIEEQEVLDFYISEIDFNCKSNDENIKTLSNLNNIYPYNAEFKHTLGVVFCAKNNYLEAIEEYKKAYKINDNSFFLEELFNVYQLYLNSLIEKSDYQTGIDIINNIFDSNILQENALAVFYRNTLLSYRDRLKDAVLFNKKIHEAEIKIKKIISKQIQTEQSKIITILSIFTAVITFIISTVSIGKQFTFKEAIAFDISLGLILILFSLLINILFSETKKKKLIIYSLILLFITIALLITMIFI